MGSKYPKHQRKLRDVVAAVVLPVEDLMISQES